MTAQSGNNSGTCIILYNYCRIGYMTAQSGNNSGTCVILYELRVGDKLYTKGVSAGQYLRVVAGREMRNSFSAHLLYASRD